MDSFWKNPDKTAHYLNVDRLKFYEEVLDELSEKKYKLPAIDIGIGSGEFMGRLSERFKIDSHLLYGVDLSIYGLLLVAKKNKIFHLTRSSADELDFYKPGFFGLTIIMETLEHLENPKKTLRSVIEMTHKGGLIIITIPDGTTDTWEGHLNRWSTRAFSKFVNDNGRGTKIVKQKKLDGGDLLFLLEKI